MAITNISISRPVVSTTIGRIYVGNGAPEDGDEFVTDVERYGRHRKVIYIDQDTAKVYTRTALNGVAADFVSTSGSGGSGTLPQEYKALLLQNGTNAPIVNNGAPLINTLGVALQYNYDEQGSYYTTGMLFDENKTEVFIAQTAPTHISAYVDTTTHSIVIKTGNDGVLVNPTCIAIIVYP